MRKIVLLGSNLVVSTVGASLQGRSDLQLTQIDALASDALQRLEAARPDIILFDLAAAQPEFAIAVLSKHPGLLLIGIDLKSDKMLVVSGEESRLLTTDDLVHMMETGK